MRCTACHSYIPEGLPAPVRCPACGGSQTLPKPDVVSPPTSSPPSNTALLEPGFAHYFTIKTRVSFGRLQAPHHIEEGSLSFGPNGFSIVWNGGKGWDKISYRDLGPAQLKNDSVVFTVRDVESRLTLYPSNSPLWMAKIISPLIGSTRTRSLIFIELLEKVKNGLSAIEISAYQRKLQ